ncbi:MAG: hypothetical protein CME15_07025 [Gemmatimonadetes bacterium]|jgi:hypothetical protein|nr:hypothetical protein [Gemmatimonadota bacterium]
MMATRRPRVAALVTEYRKYSHGQNIVDRLMGGYGWGTRWHHPELDVVSLYVDQFPESDLSREREARHEDLRIYPTIAEALTLGGSKLDVDGVLLIAEHGVYPKNEQGQTLYPRYEFFQQTADVFRSSGRSVPVFCDKHLSWNWEWAQEMVAISGELGFPMMAGSSLPISRRVPSIDLPWGAETEEIVGVGVGGIDSYDIHTLEAMQCLVERRQGGETGVSSVHAMRGDSVWQALDEGAWDPALFEACLCRSFSLEPADESHRHTYPTREQLPQLVRSEPVAYRIEYTDGLKGTMFLVEGLVRDITAAVRLAERQDPLSLLFYLGAGHEMQPNFFNPMCHHIENLIVHGTPPFPIERTLLTTGLGIAGVTSLWREEKLATPHLDIHYLVDPSSTFRRV